VEPRTAIAPYLYELARLHCQNPEFRAVAEVRLVEVAASTQVESMELAA